MCCCYGNMDVSFEDDLVVGREEEVCDRKEMLGM